LTQQGDYHNADFVVRNYSEAMIAANDPRPTLGSQSELMAEK